MTYNLDRVRAVIQQTEQFCSTFSGVMEVSEETKIISWLLDQVDTAQANIDAAREHLQSVVSEQRYVGTRVQTEAQRALDLLDGEPDGADL